MKVTVTKEPKSSLKINVIVPVAKVKEAYGEVIKEHVTKAELPGFRKGQAPDSVVKEKLDTSDLNGEIVNRLLKTHYSQALKENKITPISNPKVEIKEFDLEKDFEFTATVATKPDIKMGEYKPALKKLFKTKQKEHKDHDHQIHISPNEVIDELIKSATLEVPEILVKEEIERMLIRVIDQTNTLGMSMEDYLKAQNKTTEQLRDEFKKSSEKSIRAELILQQLIEEEKIKVSEKEIENAINAVGDPKTKKEMETPLQRWYIKSVLAKNKFLSKLIEEAEASKEKEDK